jgi:RNA polymerase sigma factor (sigma-70 family)
MRARPERHPTSGVPMTPSLPTDSPASPADDEELLLYITRLARRVARRLVAVHDVDDVAQDVVLECLVKLRNGYWVSDPSSTAKLVRSIAKRRALDCLRRQKRQDARDAEHDRTLSESVHAWMSPDLSHEVRELNEVHARAMAALPDACRRAFVLVRDEDLAYKIAAERLGITRKTVQSHVVRAQGQLVEALREHGVTIPRRARNGAVRANASLMNARRQ